MSRLPSTVRQLIAALRGLLIFTVICGIIYPLVMFGIAQVAFHKQANGSLVSFNHRVVGSSLLCQEFVDAKGNPLPQYFQPRPSAASAAGVKTDYGCNPLYSAATNLGPDNPTLVQLIKQRQQQIAAFDHVAISAIPADAVTASASGLDPDIISAERRYPGGPGGRGQARQPDGDHGAGQAVHHRPRAGHPRRASGQRAAAEHRARPEIPRTVIR